MVGTFHLKYYLIWTLAIYRSQLQQSLFSGERSTGAFVSVRGRGLGGGGGNLTFSLVAQQGLEMGAEDHTDHTVPHTPVLEGKLLENKAQIIPYVCSTHMCSGLPFNVHTHMFSGLPFNVHTYVQWPTLQCAHTCSVAYPSMCTHMFSGLPFNVHTHMFSGLPFNVHTYVQWPTLQCAHTYVQWPTLQCAHTHVQCTY